MNRKSIFILAAGLAMAVATACEPGPPPGPPPIGPPSYTASTYDQSVYYFGDSLGAMSRDVERAWYDQQAPPVRTYDNNIIAGTTLQQWWATMAQLPEDATVVVELGTNNITNEAINTGALESSLRGTFEILRDRVATRTVWFTLNEYSAAIRGFPYDQRARWVNQFMRGLVDSGEYADIGLEVYDWNALAQPAEMSILVDDKVHHNALGIEWFGRAMYEAVNGPTVQADSLAGRIVRTSGAPVRVVRSRAG